MLNHVTLMGRLTRDPERKVTGAGVSVTHFAVAVERDFNRSMTDFIECVAWRQNAEFIDRYFKRGDMIAVTGSLQTDEYTDRNGARRKSYVVSVEHAYFTGGKKEAAAQPELEDITDDDADLPF